MDNEISILSSCTSGGCGAKIGADTLRQILSEMPKKPVNELIVGYESSDDAAVYDMDGENCIISTLDFFSPMVDDAYDFGQIAAANALSDVYAMGGEVLFALNIVSFPRELPEDMLKEILKGGLDKMHEAGGVIAGGHSIYDTEPKYGLAVTGRAKKSEILKNNTPKMGDKLILTKALGVGIIMSAARNGAASQSATDTAIKSMKKLNKFAAEKMRKYKVNACTDVTGFGLLSHLSEMCGNEGVGANLYVDKLPVIKEALDYAKEGFITSAGGRNRRNYSAFGEVSAIDERLQEVLFDPQTSGGLLMAVNPEDAEALLNEIRETNPEAEIIGEIVAQKTDKVNFIR